MAEGSSLIVGGSGGLLAVHVLKTAGAFTATLQDATRRLHIRLVGGGASGGGAPAAAAGQIALGSGGGAGAYIEHYLTPSATVRSFSGVVGTGGPAGAAGANGVAGTATTFVYDTLTLTAGGGSQGTIVSSAATVISVGGGNSGVPTAFGDIRYEGEEGGAGVRYSGTVARSGRGANTPLGTGGSGRSSGGTGNPGHPATGQGAGGGGAMAVNGGAAQAGGVGVDGCVIVEEYG